MTARQLRLICVCAFALPTLAGCQTANVYTAESLPDSLRIVPQSNPQEVDISRLARPRVSSQTIVPGDVLELNIAASLSPEDQVTLPLTVADDGSTIVPDIGRVQVAGLEPQAAELFIRTEAVNRGLYRNPAVTVSFAQQKMNKIWVMGAVKEPGPYELRPDSSDVVTAIAAAQGLSENAGENVHVRNPGFSNASVGRGRHSAVTSVSHSTTLADDSNRNDYSISLISGSRDIGRHYGVSDGGVVMVEKRDPEPVQVLGLVTEPGVYDYPIGKPLRLLGAIALAKGTDNQLADRVSITRPRNDDQKPTVIKASLRKARNSMKSNIVLAPGDVVHVEQTPGTVFMEAIQLIRFGVSGSAPLF